MEKIEPKYVLRKDARGIITTGDMEFSKIDAQELADKYNDKNYGLCFYYPVPVEQKEEIRITS